MPPTDTGALSDGGLSDGGGGGGGGDNEKDNTTTRKRKDKKWVRYTRGFNNIFLISFLFFSVFR